MERKYFKAINFDLNTNKLKEYYPRYQQAYNDLSKFFKENNFYHRQGSGYVSNEKMTSADIIDLMGDLQKKYLWAGDCIKAIDVTNVGPQYDLMPLFTVEADDEDETAFVI